jgi:hypothetical protein
VSREVNATREDNLNPYLVYAFVVLAVLVGLCLCLAGRGGVHLFGDEFHSIWNLHRSFSRLMKRYDMVGSGVALPLMQRAAVGVFGPGLWAYRFPALLGAIATLVIIYPAGKRLVGQTPAVIASLALAANSIHIFYSRFARSYALMVFLAIVLVYALNRAMAADERRRVWYAIVAISAGLLPFAHLSAAAFVVGVGVAAIVTVLIERRAGQGRNRLVASLVIGAVLCICLHLSAWDSLRQFIGAKTGQGSLSQFSVLDVAALLAGSRPAGVIWLIGVPVAAILMLIRKRIKALVLIAAVFAPVVAVVVTKPEGMAYAYARYLLTALPFMLMLMAWLLLEALHATRLPARISDYAGLAVGAVLVVASFLTGPLGLKHTDDGPFANTYLSMTPLPAFDVPWDKTPPFYKTLADSTEPVRIIEAPELLSRSVLLYRNYYLQHRKEVMIGFVSVEPVNVPAGPYVSLLDPKSIKNSDADYMILHLDVFPEVASYWQFVYDSVWPAMEDPRIESLMVRHSKYWIQSIDSLQSLAGDLEGSLGKPVYKDERIVVWELKS